MNDNGQPPCYTVDKNLKVNFDKGLGLLLAQSAAFINVPLVPQNMTDSTQFFVSNSQKSVVTPK